MMKKIEMEIIALSHSITQTHSYAVVLGEVNGLRRLPIVIGGYEAQAIAVALERMNPTRPLSHDLMKNIMLAFGADLHEIVINDFQEGIFYAQLICSSSHYEVELDSRTSDAIALAVRFGCPIFTYENILDKAGVVFEDHHKTEIVQEEPDEKEDESEELKDLTLEDLNSLLSEVLEHEDYIKAIAIRDEIKRRESK